VAERLQPGLIGTDVGIDADGPGVDRLLDRGVARAATGPGVTPGATRRDTERAGGPDRRGRSPPQKHGSNQQEDGGGDGDQYTSISRYVIPPYTQKARFARKPYRRWRAQRLQAVTISLEHAIRCPSLL